MNCVCLPLSFFCIFFGRRGKRVIYFTVTAIILVRRVLMVTGILLP